MTLDDEGVVDGLSVWISGPHQDSLYANLTALVRQIRTILGGAPTNKQTNAALGPNNTRFPIYTGGYVTYSSIGWMQPAPFWALLKQSVALYENTLIPFHPHHHHHHHNRRRRHSFALQLVFN